MKLAAFNEPDEFVPLGMRQANDVFMLADRNVLIGNLDLRASRAGWTEGELFRLHRYIYSLCAP